MYLDYYVQCNLYWFVCVETGSTDSVEVAVDTTPAQPERIATALFNFEPSGHMDHIAMRKGVATTHRP